MPKRVDHAERREQLAEALLRIVADRGLEAVSLRHVGAEAGVTSGMVQHYFRSKDELMAFALEVVSERVQARAAAAMTGADSARAEVRALVISLLPLDEPRRLEGRVALAFVSYSTIRPELAAALQQNTTGMREHFAEQIRQVWTEETRLGMTPLQAATGLLALVEGLGMHLLGEHYAPEEAVSVLDAHLELLFGQSMRRSG
ncbi:TetR family transcriptional regulator C-terminal domain-containing protein [Allokutzneria sp. A3M-2-11 16]|uniref:TetR/AcrR family transcriptional regulator n=1 Tax=Allokutzneria sp. A3M-2-11 16 TaxID=2962043 RepID=UPI0020B7D6B4|nr:TetR family transcriptional regulator C-terminal domain-containing protein [Allokutzneria sp. A3M-2-11 16]MCP3802802.1 TetR family transcriptional regulator C-terminal domain-containing protein [Allokutzneria sp. A3M-2-11 16]